MGAIAALLAAALLAARPAAARAEGWSARARIPGIHEDAETPYLVTDRNRTVHAFHSQPGRDDAADTVIVYSRWTLHDGWTMPVDVVFPVMRKQASILGALLDEHGVMHVVFFSGDDAVANLYYSRAWASAADSPRAWAPPVLIGEAAIVPRTAALARDAHGTLAVVYSGTRQGIGLYSVHSSDQGATWSDAVPMLLVDREDLRPWANNDLRAWNPQMAPDDAGRLHLTWVVVGRDGNGKAIYYASRDVGAPTWSAPFQIATVDPGEYEVDWPSIVAYHGELLLMYNDTQHGPPRRTMRSSTDGGRTWRDPVQVLTPAVGEYGTAAFAVDGADTLHVVYGNRARGLNLWHGIWDGTAWGESEPIAPVTEADTHRSGPEEFHPSRPRVVVSQGNVLLAAWRTDPGRTHNGTWFAYKCLDVPESPAKPLPPAPLRGTSQPIVVGAIAVALLMGVAVQLHHRRARTHRAKG